MSVIRRAVAVLLFASAFATIAAAAPAPSTSMPGMSASAHPSASAADTAMMRGMDKMQQDMAAAPMTGNPDQDFVAMMIPHHQGAIDMAQVELQFGKDPALRKLAQTIIAAQQQEIAQMKAAHVNAAGR